MPRELKSDTGVVTEAELMKLLADFEVKLPEEIEIPFSVKLTRQHTLVVEPRSARRVTTNGLEQLYSWRLHENMVSPVRREY